MSDDVCGASAGCYVKSCCAVIDYPQYEPARALVGAKLLLYDETVRLLPSSDVTNPPFGGRQGEPVVEHRGQY